MAEHTRDQLQARISQLDPSRRGQLLSALRSDHRGPRATSGWFLRPKRARDPKLRLFCFPYAGGGASIFRGWPSALLDGVEIVAVQLPGREARVAEPAYRSMGELLPALVEAVTPLTDVPFAFFGHSMGALTAFELTRALREDGHPLPERLLLSAFRAPQLPNPNIRIYHLPDEVLKTVLLKEGTPAEVLRNDELMRALLPTLRADFELCDTYEYQEQAPLQLPMHIFGGHHDVRVAREDLQEWSHLTQGPFDLTMLPGSHFFIHGSQDLLTAAINDRLSTNEFTQGVVA